MNIAKKIVIKEFFNEERVNFNFIRFAIDDIKVKLLIKICDINPILKKMNTHCKYQVYKFINPNFIINVLNNFYNEIIFTNRNLDFKKNLYDFNEISLEEKKEFFFRVFLIKETIDKFINNDFIFGVPILKFTEGKVINFNIDFENLDFFELQKTINFFKNFSEKKIEENFFLSDLIEAFNLIIKIEKNHFIRITKVPLLKLKLEMITENVTSEEDIII